MNQNENGLPGSQRGFEEVLQVLETFKEMATKVIEELIRKPAVNKSYHYHEYHGPVYNYHGMLQKDPQESGMDSEEEPPSPSDMAAACEQTLEEGLWWGHTSWSVVYRIYCIKGYKGNMSAFTKEVEKWPLTDKFPYNCDKDSVGKPLQRGKMAGPLEKWGTEGAQPKEIKLGERLMELL